MNSTELFHNWVSMKLDEYVKERPRPTRENYSYSEAFESALWSWTECYQTRLHQYQSQEEGFKAALEIAKKEFSK